jgi:hypothetical protein
MTIPNPASRSMSRWTNTRPYPIQTSCLLRLDFADASRSGCLSSTWNRARGNHRRVHLPT